MKLISLHIHCFGKLRNVDINFCDGVNVISKNNSFGKTTLAAFIRAMLYGFKYNSTKLSTGERGTDVSRWLPWNIESKIGGSIKIEQNGDIYCVERYFGAKASQETLSVYNERSGKKVDVETSVGEMFLGLTAESFDRSAYFPQEAVELASNENLDTRLAGLVQNAEDYSAVYESLNDYRKSLLPARGKGGLINELENKRMELEQQLFERRRATARQTEIENRIAQIAREKIDAQQKLDDSSARTEKLQKQIAHAQPSEEQLNNARKLAQLEEKLNRQKDLPQDYEICVQLADKIAKTPEETKAQRPLSVSMLIVGLVLLALGVGVCFLQLAVGICIAFVGVICSILAFFVRPQITTLQAGEKDAYITEYYKIVSKYVNCVGMEYSQAQKALSDVYVQYIGDKSACDTLKTAVVQAIAQKSNVEEWQRLLYDAQQIARQAQQTLQQLSREEGALIAEKSSLNTDCITVTEQLATVEAKLTEAKKQLETVGTVMQLLERAKENLSTSYLPTLSAQCSQLLNLITNGRFETKLDRNFTLRLQENGITKPLEYFSRGIREITLLCFRVALSQMLYGGEIPFLIIDDAFVNFDEENFLQATKLLKKLSVNTQIVYFTCHNRLGALK